MYIGFKIIQLDDYVCHTQQTIVHWLQLYRYNICKYTSVTVAVDETVDVCHILHCKVALHIVKQKLISFPADF